MGRPRKYGSLVEPGGYVLETIGWTSNIGVEHALADIADDGQSYIAHCGRPVRIEEHYTERPTRLRDRCQACLRVMYPRAKRNNRGDVGVSDRLPRLTTAMTIVVYGWSVASLRNMRHLIVMIDGTPPRAACGNESSTELSYSVYSIMCPVCRNTRVWKWYGSQILDHNFARDGALRLQ